MSKNMIGRTDGWNDKKTSVMQHVIEKKIEGCPHTASQLKATGSRPLIENVESSNFWGIGPNGNGQNTLGKLLENARTTLLAVNNSNTTET